MKPALIEIPEAKLVIPILFENRSIIAIDKPAGWLLAPSHWKNTSRNLQRTLELSILARDFWARSRNLKYIRFLHRLDAETSGVLLLVKNPGAIPAYNKLFAKGLIEKYYAAVVHGVPQWKTFPCRLSISQSPDNPTKMRINKKHGKFAETIFTVVATRADKTLLIAQPLTGRTHQIRVHLTALGLPILGDKLYGEKDTSSQKQNHTIALRACRVRFKDPFENKLLDIQAPMQDFLSKYGFELIHWQWQNKSS